MIEVVVNGFIYLGTITLMSNTSKVKKSGVGSIIHWFLSNARIYIQAHARHKRHRIVCGEIK